MPPGDPFIAAGGMRTICGEKAGNRFAPRLPYDPVLAIAHCWQISPVFRSHCNKAAKNRGAGWWHETREANGVSISGE